MKNILFGNDIDKQKKRKENFNKLESLKALK